MALNAKEAFSMVKQSAKDFGDDDCPRLAAALAYYIVFALPPLLILIMKIVGTFVSQEQVQSALSGQFGQMIGSDGAKTVQTMIASAKQPGGGVLSTVLGIAALVLGATGAFMQLQSALDRAWEVKPDPRAGGIKNFIFKRVLSLGMILGIAFLLLVSLALSAATTALGGMIGQIIPGGSAVVAAIVQTVVSLGVVFLLFAAIFKVLPDARIAWRDVWVGALVTAVLFEIGKWGLGLYLGHSNPGKAYGAAGSLAVMLVWIYYTAMIVLFGAEFTQVWATQKGSGIEPEEGALRMVEATMPADEAAAKGLVTEDATKTRRPAASGHEPSHVKSARRAAAQGDPAKAAEKLAAKDRDPDDTRGNDRGLPGGGVGRREAVGGSGVHPLSAGTAPEDAETRGQRDFGRGPER